MTKHDSTAPPNPPAAASIHHSRGGQHKYASSDGGLYAPGMSHLFGTAIPQSIVTAVGSYANISGLSCPVAAGRYKWLGWYESTQGPNGNAQNFNITGPATSAGRYHGTFLVGGGAFVGISSSAALGTAITTPLYATGTVWESFVYGWVTFTAPGTLTFRAGEGGTPGASTVNAAGLGR